jgi:hypothetical protein
MAAIVGLVAAGPALAQQKSVNNVGCGLGSMAWEGETGLAPQVLAATTNGTVGNQTFGISSHTLGCARNGKVLVPERMAMFIGPNMNQLAQDMSRGDGEALATLAYVIGIETQHRAAFFAATQREFARIMPHENVTATDVANAITAVLREDAALSRYADV